MESDIKAVIERLAPEIGATPEEAYNLALIGSQTAFKSDLSIVNVLASNDEDFDLEGFLLECIALGMGVIASKLNG